MQQKDGGPQFVLVDDSRTKNGASKKTKVHINEGGETLQVNELKGNYGEDESKKSYTTKKLRDFCLELLEDHEVI